MDADRSSPENGPADPWATGRRRPGRPDRGRRPGDGAAAGTPGAGANDADTRDAGAHAAVRDAGAHAGARDDAEPGSAMVHVPRAGAAPDREDDRPGPRETGAARPTGPGPDGDPWAHWRKLRPRTVRGASALGLVGAAVLLLPFLDDPDRWWVPVGLGFGTLLLLTLFRLDRLLNGWAPHVAGVVLVGALLQATARNPWAWGLALGVGVVVAGLLLLPRWKVLAVGGVLLVVSGAGYTFRSAEIRQDQARIDAQAGAQMRAALGVDRPQLALVALDTGVADGNPARVCRLVQDPAIEQLRLATGAATCEDAIAVLHSRVPSDAPITTPDRQSDPDVPPGGSTVVDGCDTAWGAAAGPQLGTVVLTRTPAATPTFQVSSFTPC
ncbi:MULTISPECIES: hypothetical protein [Pseudonocardia]|uniref:Uncharacterized protein n=2 Tax=Pseudonocardia TaxID=1847 RepID=A0A1Y2MS15_PSEAH|nr:MULTISPECIES: hypothetical protein [Pseudonocardia]OSY38016.1 hypothetical protein BG845_04423 [Pseudonocardia autotrophica]TDN74677.1 hypothetical protein C8E95_3804 [Pseudonocardia autotrophica]BBG05448.1 hypothetical protein Pdca_66570 [Pseudonocardia autotrophica]GEC26380.1 hypothetical protein PSA01_34090 [Pseudonocardia saturnea]